MLRYSRKRKPGKSRLEDRVCIHTDKLKYVMRMPCGVLGLSGPLKWYMHEWLQQSSCFGPMCYPGKTRLQGTTQVNTALQPRLLQPTINHGLPSWEEETTKRNVFPKLEEGWASRQTKADLHTFWKLMQTLKNIKSKSNNLNYFP